MTIFSCMQGSLRLNNSFSLALGNGVISSTPLHAICLSKQVSSMTIDTSICSGHIALVRTRQELGHQCHQIKFPPHFAISSPMSTSTPSNCRFLCWHGYALTKTIPGVGHFCSTFIKWSVANSEACLCGTKEQTAHNLITPSTRSLTKYTACVFSKTA